ncbi:hypothetical protein QBC46DRAFT_404700 [Diplogelasinospora grovesii]|uniref:Uncharacterized protein n=1 Tax=Diplogelasinospora grovesii TaxID=303347 RepID=A0AAN6S883_9PEZI|nr:hypothetical protein QBC46DRAFT_404700 [Diplogelasinospora grovesii]
MGDGKDFRKAPPASQAEHHHQKRNTSKERDRHRHLQLARIFESQPAKNVYPAVPFLAVRMHPTRIRKSQRNVADPRILHGRGNQVDRQYWCMLFMEEARRSCTKLTFAIIAVYTGFVVYSHHAFWDS